MLSDPIADMLTRIRNAYAAKKTKLTMPYSNVKLSLAKVLKSEGYLTDFKKLEKDNKQDLEITLSYKNGEPGLTHISRVSKIGRRVYAKKDELPYVLSGHGHAIVSTSKGVMTAVKARKQSLGGEIICKVW